jgi:hypothetical protein
MIDNDARDVMVSDTVQVLLADQATGGGMRARVSTVLMVAAWLGLFVLWLLVKPT